MKDMVTIQRISLDEMIIESVLFCRKAYHARLLYLQME